MRTLWLLTLWLPAELALGAPPRSDPDASAGPCLSPRETSQAGPPASTSSRASSLSEAVRRTASRPSVEEVVGAALRKLGHDHREAQQWRRRLSWSALLPKLSARFNQTRSEGELLDLRANSPTRLDLSGYLSLRFEVQASWDLSRLLFDPRELRVSSRASQLQQERDALVERVVRLYFERVRLLLMARVPEQADQPTLERQIALQQVTATLDALTGGLLSIEERRRR